MHEVSVRHGARIADRAESGQALIVQGPVAHEEVAPGAATPHISTGRIDQLKVTRIMREVQASEAKTHLPQLLDDVERGETIVITRHGRPIARLVPDADSRRAEVAKAIEGIMELRKRTGKVTLQEILDARHEGHKY
jgi:prevent-host-death family protein